MRVLRMVLAGLVSGCLGAAAASGQGCKPNDFPDAGKCLYLMSVSAGQDWSCHAGDERMLVLQMPAIPLPPGFTQQGMLPSNLTALLCRYTAAVAPPPVTPGTGGAPGGGLVTCRPGDVAMGSMCTYTPATGDQTISAGCQAGEQILPDGSCVHNAPGGVCPAGQTAFGTGQCRYSPGTRVIQMPGPCKAGDQSMRPGTCMYRGTPVASASPGAPAGR